jgi:hypothetical protein
LQKQSDGSYKISTQLINNQVLVMSNINNNGTTIQLWDDYGSNNQRKYFLYPKSTNAFIMDVYGMNDGTTNTVNGSGLIKYNNQVQVQIWTYNATDYQRWELVPVSGGGVVMMLITIVDQLLLEHFLKHLILHTKVLI